LKNVRRNKLGHSSSHVKEVPELPSAARKSRGKGEVLKEETAPTKSGMSLKLS